MFGRIYLKYEIMKIFQGWFWISESWLFTISSMLSLLKLSHRARYGDKVTVTVEPIDDHRHRHRPESPKTVLSPAPNRHRHRRRRRLTLTVTDAPGHLTVTAPVGVA